VIRLYANLLVLALLPALTAHALAPSLSFVETFDTQTYADLGATTAEWSTATGELRAPALQPSLLGIASVGDAFDVVIDGHLAYVATRNNGLSVVNISDPSAPVVLGGAGIGQATTLDVDGNLAVVCVGSAGAKIVDVSDPTSPTLLATFLPDFTVRNADIHGPLVFLVGETSLAVLDISDPTRPALRSVLRGMGTLAQDVRATGTHVFVAATTELVAIDVTLPGAPVRLDQHVTSGVEGVAVSGTTVFLTSVSGLRVLAASDPGNLSLVGSLGSFQGTRLELDGGWLYGVNDNAGLIAADVSDPSTPILATGYNTPGSALGLGLGRTIVAVADRTTGELQLVNVAVPVPPQSSPVLDTYFVRDAVRVGNLVYAARDAAGIAIYDVSDPANTTFVGSAVTTDATKIRVDDDVAYVADWTGDLRTFDVSDPTTPVALDSLSIPGNTIGIDLYGSLAVVTQGYDFVQPDILLAVVDITDPTALVLLGTVALPGTGRSVVAHGSVAYVADGSAGVTVVDISDPTAPVIIGSTNLAGVPEDIVAVGDRLYVAELSDLHVLDISNPAAPAYLGGFTPNSSFRGLDVIGTRVFTGSLSSLLVLDATDPANIVLENFESTPGFVYSVHAHGDFVTTGTTSGGIQSWRIFHRVYDVTLNVARSLTLPETTQPIRQFRYNVTETTPNLWRLDLGLGFVELARDQWWTAAPAPTSIRWETVLESDLAGTRPIVSEIEFDFIYDAPVIHSVTDVPNDQGRQVRLQWSRAFEDRATAGTPVLSYAVYREIDPDLRARNGDEHPLRKTPAQWDFIGDVPARGDDSYATIVPTLADSTVSEGAYLSTFLVSAVTGTPTEYFDSWTASGYSLDNLEPLAPLMLAVVPQPGGIDLTWLEASESDFSHYRVYRGVVDDFPTNPGSLLGTTIAAAWTDPGTPTGFFYKVTVVDFSGNESPPSTTRVVAAVDGTLPERMQFAGAAPNPFNPRTTLSFELPREGHVTLDVYDMVGRRVRELTQGWLAGGSYRVVWDGTDTAGRSVASGMYYARLVVHDEALIRKMVLVR